MHEYKEAVANVAERAGLPHEEARAAVTIPKERDRADLSLPCFRWAKAMKKAPPEIAATVAAAFAPDQWLSSAEATGPFVNFRLDRTSFTKKALAATGPDHGRSDQNAGKTVVIDYGSPNIAKPLLFHHLRSGAIGQALCNLFRWRGYEVVGINFLGDVGTAFGKLMVGVEEFGEPTTVEAFNRTYVDASRGCEEHAEWMDRARAWAKRLEDGDETAVGFWESARALSLQEFAVVYEWLGIKHDVVDGERMYVDAARDLVEKFLAEGKAQESDGGVIIETGMKTPYLVRKSDGATLYGTRDIAAAIDRWDRYHFARMLYVHDVAQELHFRQLFAALARIGCMWADRCTHVKFGQVLVGGTRAKTREGQSVHLDEVLREGTRRALAIIEQKNSELKNKEAVAKAVGTAAVVFSDVGFPVTKNINFDWDEILSFDGRTGPYLQYVHASACSILRKGGEPGDGDTSLLVDDREWDLVRRLAEFPDAVTRATDDCEPSHVAGFLYDLAREFRAYHSAGSQDRSLRVLVEDGTLRAARLTLCRGVRDTLAVGLRLLGIEPVEEM